MIILVLQLLEGLLLLARVSALGKMGKLLEFIMKMSTEDSIPQVFRPTCKCMLAELSTFLTQ